MVRVWQCNEICYRGFATNEGKESGSFSVLLDYFLRTQGQGFKIGNDFRHYLEIGSDIRYFSSMDFRVLQRIKI